MMYAHGHRLDAPVETHDMDTETCPNIALQPYISTCFVWKTIELTSVLKSKCTESLPIKKKVY